MTPFHLSLLYFMLIQQNFSSYLDLLLFFDLLHCLRVFFIFVSLCIFFHLMDSFVLSTFQFKILKLKCFVILTNIPCLVCWDLLNSWKEIYPVCIFESFIGKEVFWVKWFHFQGCLNIYAYQNTSQSLCRRIFRHFFDREIAMIFFSLKFCLPNVNIILLLFNILRNN